jgi:uncharacterized protein YkwD
MLSMAISKESNSSRSEQKDSKPASSKTSRRAGTDKGGTDNQQSSVAVNAPINAAAFDADLLSRLVFDLTNRERSQAGLPAFSPNKSLAYSATEHSQDMASHNYFAHKSKGFLHRTDPRDRVEAMGYNPQMVAENIAMVPTYTGQTIQSYPGYGSQVVKTDYTSYGQLATTAMREWMNSPGHRANILNNRLSSLGVGVAVGVKGNVPYVYLTQNFGG